MRLRKRVDGTTETKLEAAEARALERARDVLKLIGDEGDTGVKEHARTGCEKIQTVLTYYTSTAPTPGVVISAPVKP